MQERDASSAIQCVKQTRKPARAKSPPPPPEMDGFSERLHRAMKARNKLNQPELAKLSGVAQGTINKLLNGKSYGTTPVVVRLALALDLPLDWWLTNVDDPVPKRSHVPAGLTLMDEERGDEVPRRQAASQPTPRAARRRRS